MVHEGNDKNSTLKTIILVGIVLLVILNIGTVIEIAKNIYGVIFPLLLGAAIAYIINILVAGYEKIYLPGSKNQRIISTRRSVCVVLSILTIVVIILFFLRIVIPQVVHSIKLLSDAIPVVYNEVVEWAQQNADQLPGLQQRLEELNLDKEAVLKRGFELLSNGAFGTVSLIGSVFGEIVNFVLAVIFAIYVLFRKEELKAKFEKLLKAYMKTERRERLYEGLRTADDVFSSYIVGQCKEAVILGILCTIGMLIFRFPYAATIGPVIGLFALIPVVGAYLGAAVGFFLIVMVDPFKAVLFILFIVILQQIEGNLIYPRVVGGSVGLPGIWVFAAIIVGGGLMGIPGVFLGVPTAATVYKLLSRSVNERLNSPAP